VNGCSDAVLLPSNTSSHLDHLLNLQRNPQVLHTSMLFLLFKCYFLSEIIIAKICLMAQL